VLISGASSAFGSDVTSCEPVISCNKSVIISHNAVPTT